MRPDRKFSRFVMGSLMLFMGISYVLIATGTYFYRIYNMEKSANAMFDISQREFSSALTNHLDNIRTNLDRLVSDDILGDHLFKNKKEMVSDTTNEKFRVEAKRIFIVYDSLNDRFIPELPANISPIEPLLKRVSTEEKQSVKFQEIGKGLFISVYSSPINHQGKRVGTGYLLYDISRDQNFWETVQGGLTLNRILIHDGEGRLCNVATGEEIVVPDKDKASLMSNTLGPQKEFYKGEKLIPLSGYPNVFYGANNRAGNQERAG
jgi:hypothetical protein